jgi:glycosyltransferase involved in cell wall biosynthesis
LREAFLASLEPDVVHITSLFEGLDDDAVVSVGKYASEIPTSATLYDLIPLINKEVYLTNPVVKKWYYDRLDNLRRVDHLLSISESSRDEAIRQLGFLPDLVTNVGTAADPQFSPRKLAASHVRRVITKYQLRNRFVMYTGGIDYRKNLELLIEAYSTVPTSARSDSTLAIVCACNAVDRDRLLNLAKSCGLSSNDFVLTGFVPEEDLIALYSAATLFIFPSWHEGFGLPALEAMQCGAPVIGSNCSSLPEVIGWREAMFDPRSQEEIASVLERGLADEEFREQLRTNGERQRKKFSWDKSARAALAALEKFASKQKKYSPIPIIGRSRLKLAYVSPLPPQKSGISSYSAELLPALSRHYQIDCIVPDGFEADLDFQAEVGSFIGLQEVSKFQQTAGKYDRVLYHIGNSEFHSHMFSMLDRVPGVVVQHDFYLSGILSYLENHYGISRVWSEALYRSHGYKALADRFAAGGFMDAIWKYPSSRQTFEQSLGTIMHSKSTQDLAQKWLPDALTRRIKVIPHLRVVPEHIDKKAARARLGIGVDQFLVCTFGIMGETKLSHRLLDAWLKSELSNAAKSQLVFVGQADSGDYGRAIANRITESGCGDRVTITGWADDDTYSQYLQACDIAVQLRTRSRGETSGTILDCMAYGKPTIINAHGSAADISLEGVVMLPDEFSEGQLLASLEKLFTDPQTAQRIGEQAQAIIRDRHSPRKCAEQYAQVIEGYYCAARFSPLGIARHLKDEPVRNFSNDDYTQIAKTICSTMPPPDEAIVYVDVSAYLDRDSANLGKAVRERVMADKRRIEPVFWSDADQRFVSARRFTLDALGISPDTLPDAEPVSFVRNSSALVISPNESFEELAKSRWGAASVHFNISCEFERYGD